MKTLVLRKGVGPLSSGTVVTIVDRDSTTGFELVRVGDKEITIPNGYLTELRNRTDFIPVNNRAKRRQSKNAEYSIMKELGF